MFILTNGVYSEQPFYYDLYKPDIKHQLPEILNEISGLTDIDNDHVACVQDELGIVFIYNFRTGNIAAQHRFDDVGDFEGLTYTNNALYILRSDGRLTEWSGFPDNSDNILHIKLPLQTANNEGLCYDSKNDCLLIAAKSKPIDHDYESKRYIYAFDLSHKTISETPIYRLNVNEIETKALEFGIDVVDSTSKGKIKKFNFRPSSLAIHPISDDIYIISATDNLLVVLTRAGEITKVMELHPDKFFKAEGITFLSDGTMIITNEAANKYPTIFVYERKFPQE